MLCGVMGREWSINSLAPSSILNGMALLWGSFIGPSSMLSLLGYVLIHLGGCSNLGLVGSGLFVGFLDK